MKELPSPLIASLASGATTLCWCWRLERRDGIVLGFTDHDRDVAFGGVVYEATAGMTASELSEQVGLSVDNLEVTGALSSERLSEAELAAGRYDDAVVEIYRVDWMAPENHVLMRSGSIGEVRRAGGAFAAEVRGLAHYLQQPKGRLFQYLCDADLGDGRCKKSVTGESYRGDGAITRLISDRRFEVSGLGAFAQQFFARGLLEILSGAAAGHKVEIKAHTRIAGTTTIEVWQPIPALMAVGDEIRATAGCDKTFATCRTKFANAANFQGFPHMPGNDFVASQARRRTG
ncbi:MAG: DUF2163 domain-containing protein [Hyphomicrobiaceae bacterium]|nr:DUF2163 domain-containing protein [Hyphomicrobiaceae bacterium]